MAAVIPHWNRVDLLRALLPNLREQRRPFDRVIVVDNGSTDGSADVARELGAEVVPLDRNIGFAGAVNRGIEAASGSNWMAILNNDVTLDPAWLERMLSAADHEGIWFGAGKALQAADRSRIDGCFVEVSRGACAWQCGSGRADGTIWNRPREIRMAPMTAALFRGQLFEEIGGLDEQFGSYLEDVDFGLRCSMAGRRGVYVPEAVAYHQGSSTLGRWNKDTVRLIARNQALLAQKHFEGMPRWPIAVGQLLWGLVAVRHGRGGSFLRGKIEGFRKKCNTCGSGSIASISGVIRESERTILDLQRESGFDGYWRAYFWLSPL